MVPVKSKSMVTYSPHPGKLLTLSLPQSSRLGKELITIKVLRTKTSLKQFGNKKIKSSLN